MKERAPQTVAVEEQWLSARNKPKRQSVGVMPVKRRSWLPKKSSKSSSSDFPLTQNSPPPPQLKTAVKQSSVTSFFKPIKNSDVTDNGAELNAGTDFSQLDVNHRENCSNKGDYSSAHVSVIVSPLKELSNLNSEELSERKKLGGKRKLYADDENDSCSSTEETYPVRIIHGNYKTESRTLENERLSCQQTNSVTECCHGNRQDKESGRETLNIDSSGESDSCNFESDDRNLRLKRKRRKVSVAVSEVVKENSKDFNSGLHSQGAIEVAGSDSDLEDIAADSLCDGRSVREKTGLTRQEENGGQKHVSLTGAIDTQILLEGDVDDIDTQLLLGLDKQDTNPKGDGCNVDTQLLLTGKNCDIDTQLLLRSNTNDIDTQLVVNHGCDADKKLLLGKERDTCILPEDNKINLQMLKEYREHDTDTQVLLENRKNDIDTQVLLGNRENDIDTQVLLHVGRRKHDIDTQVLLGNRKSDIDTQVLLGNRKSDIDTQVLLGNRKSDIDTQVLLGNRKSEIDTQVLLGKRSGNVDTQVLLGNRKSDNDTQVLLGNKKWRY